MERHGVQLPHGDRNGWHEAGRYDRGQQPGGAQGGGAAQAGAAYGRRSTPSGRPAASWGPVSAARARARAPPPPPSPGLPP
jgi:hypothetical protein